jgi:hypothetical protein
MMAAPTLNISSRFPLTASIYLERNDPDQHAGMWLRWVYTGWSRQQIAMPFWDYVETLVHDQAEFLKMVRFETGQTDLHPFRAALCFELFKRAIEHVNSAAARHA